MGSAASQSPELGEKNYRKRFPCIEVIQGLSQSCPWRITSWRYIVSNVAEAFRVCIFNWVSREANKAPHVLARWSLKNRLLVSLI